MSLNFYNNLLYLFMTLPYLLAYMSSRPLRTPYCSDTCSPGWRGHTRTVLLGNSCLPRYMEQLKYNGIINKPFTHHSTVVKTHFHNNLIKLKFNPK